MSFPVEFFAFPLNLLLFLLWVVAVVWLWRNCRKSLTVRFLLSPAATILAVLLPLAGCLAIGLTGRREWAATWISVPILLYFQTVLAMVILRGYRLPTATGARLGSVRWRFVFLHLGLLVTVASAFWGAPDTDSARVMLHEGESAAAPGYEITIYDIRVEKEPEGMPSSYEVDLAVDGLKACLMVNHPIKAGSGRNIYLVSCGDSPDSDRPYCVLEEVYEPWRYGAAAGIIMMLAGAFMLFVFGPQRRGRNDD